MALVTSNLRLSLILQTLEIAGTKAIFYNGSTLRTKTQLEAVVNKSGLNPTYCPGSTADERITNLLNNRKLSYFKGYEHFPTDYLLVSPSSLNFLSVGGNGTVTINSNVSWSVSENATWLNITGASNSGDDTFTVVCASNSSSFSRSATITIVWSGINRLISVYQEGTGGDPCY